FAYRPAPIQAHFLGVPATTGAKFIDYIFVDPFVVPKDQQPFFSERPMHLPDCYQCNDDKRMPARRGFRLLLLTRLPRTFSTSGCGSSKGFRVACSGSWTTIPGHGTIWRAKRRHDAWRPNGSFSRQGCPRRTTSPAIALLISCSTLSLTAPIRPPATPCGPGC